MAMATQFTTSNPMRLECKKVELTIKVKAIDTNTQPPEDPPEDPPPDLPSPFSFSLCFHKHIVPVFVFIVVVGCSLTLFVGSDIYLATTEQNFKVKQDVWESRWWAIPPLQTLFFLAIILSTGEVLIRWGPKRKKNTAIIVSQVSMIGVFFLGCILVLSVPSLTLKEQQPLNRTVERGNCTNARLLKYDTCKYIPLDFVHVANDLPRLELGQNLDRDEKILKIFQLVDELEEFKTAFVYLEDLHFTKSSGSAHLMKLFETVCVDALFDYVCSIVVTPCTYSSCTTVLAELNNCSVLRAERWLKCGVDKCEKDQECNPLVDFTAEKIHNMLLYIPSALTNIFTDFKEQGYNNKVELFKFLFEKLDREIRVYRGFQTITRSGNTCQKWTSQSPHKHSMALNGGNGLGNHNYCRKISEGKIWCYTTNQTKRWEFCDVEPDYVEPNPLRIGQTMLNNMPKNLSSCNFRDKLDNKPSDDTPLTCNPNITMFLSDKVTYYYDASNIFVPGFSIVVLMLFFTGEGIVIPFPNAVRICSLTLGLFITLIIFVGGVNVERASIIKLGGQPNLELQIWASCYYLVSWMCFHHVLCMVIPDNNKKKSKKIISRHRGSAHDQQICCCECTIQPKSYKCLNMLFHFFFWFRTEVWSSRGKYYLVRFYMKEIFEVVFQLVGVYESSGETNAYSVYVTSIVIGLNLIVVPLVLESTLLFSGPTLATGLTMFAESIFDKAFIVLSVLMRTTKTTVGGTNFSAKVLRHGLTLLPALSFALYKSSYVRLAAQYNEHTKSQSHKNIISRRRAKSFERRESFVVMKEKNYLLVFFVKIVGVVSVICGMIITIGVSYRFSEISAKCVQQLGPIAQCAFPRHYFSNGIFGKTSCGEEMYTTFDCRGRLLGVSSIPENHAMYSRMINLTSIDVSNNELESIPESFASIPSLKSLNFESNPSLSKLPYIVCSKPSSITVVNLTGTKVEKELDWSNQLLKSRSTLSVHSGCINAFENSLVKLSLANNNLTCHRNYRLRRFAKGDDYGYSGSITFPKEDGVVDLCSSYAQVKQFRRLSYLNLRNNSIHEIRNQNVFPFDHILVANESSGVSLENNAINNMVLLSRKRQDYQRIFKMTKSMNPIYLSNLQMRISNIKDEDLVEFALKRFSNLKFVDFEGNLLRDTKIVSQNLPPSVEWLDLSGNNIQVLKATAFPGLQQLIHLSLYFQPNPGLRQIEPGAFQGLRNLKGLILSGVQLQNLQSGSFEGLENLQMLDLTSSLIAKIERLAFVGLNNLRELILCAYGKITSTSIGDIDIEAFQGLTNLRKLSMYKRFNVSILAPMVNLVEVNLYGVDDSFKNEVEKFLRRTMVTGAVVLKAGDYCSPQGKYI